jgi:hypothetical protein
MAPATAERLGLSKVNSFSASDIRAQALEQAVGRALGLGEKKLLASDRQSEYVSFLNSCSASDSRDELFPPARCRA